MKFNDKAFSKITLQAAYWAGFIAADGCIFKINLNVAQAEKELKHLKKLVCFLKYKNKIYKAKHKNSTQLQCSIVLYNATQIVQDLKKHYKITKKKSLTLKFPTNLTKKQKIAFIAGYIDGDGCIDNLKNRPRIRIVGTKSFLNSIKHFFDKHYPPTMKHIVSSKPRKTFSNAYEYGIKLNRAKSFKKQVLKLNLPLMNRKWEKIDV